MKPIAYLELAETLVASGLTATDGERRAASSRAAISRAYYAAFNFALDFLTNELKLKEPPESGVHAYVIRLLNQSGERTLESASSALNTLREWRVVSDYDTKKYVIKKPNAEDPKYAKLRCGEARIIIQQIINCTPRQRQEIKQRLEKSPLITNKPHSI